MCTHAVNGVMRKQRIIRIEFNNGCSIKHSPARPIYGSAASPSRSDSLAMKMPGEASHGHSM